MSNDMHDRIKAIPLLDAALTGIALGGWHAPAAYKLGHDVATDAAAEIGAEGDARIAELLDELLREGEDHAQSVRDAAEILRQLNAAERRLVAAERVAKSLDWIMSNAGEWCHGNVNADVDREAIAALDAAGYVGESYESAAQNLGTLLDRIAELEHRLEAADRMADALLASILAMRAPLDGWKGDVERAALDKANPALAAYRGQA